MSDPLFPMPEPTFLWVYRLWVVPQPASPVVDEETGRWRYAPATGASVSGYLALADRREVVRAAARGVQVSAVALVPNGTPVDETARLEARADAAPPLAEIPDHLLGAYEITEVRPNASHTRVVLNRLVGEDPPHA